ncbi:hypothetical protein IJI91_01110 [Candidatus Saccharibacteria bacterium]|nr:hypothetical protein [Candidatus Saccharibacteria bacterium]
MDGQEYLDQISASTAPSGQASKFDLKNILSSKLFRIIGAGVILIILLIVVGNIISSASNKGRELAEQLELRLTNLATMLDEESNEYLKDTDLRSYNTALIGIIKDTDTKLTDYLTEAYKFNTKNIPANIQKEETAYIEALQAELEEARLNGLYDRTYVNSMSTEINLIIALEENILDRTSSEGLANILNQSIANFTSILETYDNYDNSY